MNLSVLNEITGSSQSCRCALMSWKDISLDHCTNAQAYKNTVIVGCCRIVVNALEGCITKRSRNVHLKQSWTNKAVFSWNQKKISQNLQPLNEMGWILPSETIPSYSEIYCCTYIKEISKINQEECSHETLWREVSISKKEFMITFDKEKINLLSFIVAWWSFLA